MYAGSDPLTRRAVRLKSTVKTEQLAHIELGRLLKEASEGRTPESDATVSKLMDEYAAIAPWDVSTRQTNEGFIRRRLASLAACWCAPASRRLPSNSATKSLKTQLNLEQLPLTGRITKRSSSRASPAAQRNLHERETPMSVRTTIAAIALAGLGLAGGTAAVIATAAAAPAAHSAVLAGGPSGSMSGGTTQGSGGTPGAAILAGGSGGVGSGGGTHGSGGSQPPPGAAILADGSPGAGSGGTTAGGGGVPPGVTVTTFGNPHVTGTASAITLADITSGGPQSQGPPIPH